MLRRMPLIIAFFTMIFCFTVQAYALPLKVDLGLITVKKKELAENLRQKLLSGQSFESLAKKHSVGPAASRGGRLGKIPVKRLRSEYKSALADLAIGKPSKVIPTEEGYTLLMLFEGSAPKKQAKPKTQPKAVKQKQQQVQPSQPLPEIPQIKARNLVMAGLESLQIGEVKQAEKHFSAALGENPRDDSAAFFLEVCHEALAGKVKNSAVKKFALAFMSMLQGELEKARNTFADAAKKDGKFWQALLFQANMEAALGDSQKALEILNRVIKINPKSSKAFISMGTSYRDQGKLDKAIEYLEKAIKVDPDSAEALYQLGSCNLEKREFKKSEKNLKRAIALDPFKDEAYNDLGLVLAKTNRPKEAEASYRKALELNPSYAPAHLNLGNLYALHNMIDKAIDEFNKALIVDPSLAVAHSNLAAAYALKEDWTTANSHAETALKMGFPVPKPLLKELAIHRR